jgi:hypothetical protein
MVKLKIVLSILLALSNIISFGQSCDTINGRVINCIDSNGIRQGQWEIRRKILLVSGYNGLGSKQGCRYFEKSNFVTRSKGAYLGGKKIDTWVYYHDWGMDNGKIEKRITYYDNGAVKEENLYNNYVILISPDSSVANGYVIYNADTILIDCKSGQCNMLFNRSIKITSFPLYQFDYEIERLFFGEYHRRIKEIKSKMRNR